MALFLPVIDKQAPIKKLTVQCLNRCNTFLLFSTGAFPEGAEE
jgi:hypothetical protein